MRDLVIGLDSSTTACKAIVWDLTGAAVTEGRAPQPMLKPQPAWHEQPAHSWWAGAVQALRQALAGIDPTRLAGLAISAQRETFVLADNQAQPIGNALLWMDERCRALLPEIDRLYGKQRIHQETGKPLSANLSLGKLFWLRRYQPELFERAAMVLDVHAYLAYHLTGRCATSYGCADPMGLFDMRHNQWDAPLLEILGLRPEQLPEVLPVGAYLGAVSAEAAQATGLSTGLPVFAGLGDGQAAGLGVAAARPGVAYLSLGTSVVSGSYSPRYLVDPAFRTMTGGVPGTYSLETVLLGGAYTVSWFIEQFGPFSGQQPSTTQQSSADQQSPAAASAEQILEAAAAEVPPGAQGLLLVPYWNSAMNPYWDASASGIMAGWRGIHGKAHFYRAILEGVAFEQRLHTSGVEAALGTPIEHFIAVGGGARSPLWRQIIADVTGKPVYLADAPEASALGAGILAAAGAGLFADIPAAAKAMTRIKPDPVLPDPEHQPLYDRLYNEVYKDLYPALRQPLARLAEITENSE